MTEYEIHQYSEFPKQYKKVAKRYPHTFDDDFNEVKKMIRKKLGWVGDNPDKVSSTDEISGLGEEVELPILKTDVIIEEAGQKTGRLIWLCDTENRRIFLIDVYHKGQRANHDEAIIRSGYKEYLEQHLN